MKILKFLCLLGALFCFFQNAAGQETATLQRQSEECEKLFGKKMKQLQAHVEEKELSPKEAHEFVQSKIENMKKDHPECFPDVDIQDLNHAEEEYQTQAKFKNKNHTTGGGKIKIDSENLSDEQIAEIDTRYRKAQEICRKELKQEVEKIKATISKARTGAERLKLMKKIDKETRLMIHECVIEKVAASF